MNYPNGIKKDFKKEIIYGNRGMSLEDDINLTNDFYITNDIACIHKKPTPIGIVNVDYKINKAIIKEAYFEKPSTTDYNGIYKGNYIDFEAKETIHNYFPLNNIHKHQVEHLDRISKMGGIGFLIVCFKKNNLTYVLFNKELQLFLKENDRKSIPIDYFEKYGYKIDYKFSCRLDYLRIVDLYLNKGE